VTAVVALDAGTTGVRALAVDQHGRVSEVAYRPLPQLYPRPGWVEQDPEAIWAACRGTLADVAERLLGRGEPVVALGLTNQRETAVAWDRRSGHAHHAAIVWQDRRTAPRCEQLAEDGHLEAVRARTGLVLDPYFSATKFEWLLGEGGVEGGPDLALGTVDAWLLWRLTGGGIFATDPTNASRTMLFDIGALRWTEELCQLFGVPPGALPEVRPSCGRVGTVAGELAALAPNLAGTPIAGVAGDQQAALFGQACVTPGLAKATYGTGTFVLVHAGSRPPEPADGLLTTVAWDLGEHAGRHEPVAYALEGSDLASGAAIEWLRDGLGILGAAGELEALAASADDSCGLVVVPAFAGLGSPRWDPRARGTVVGITRGAGRAQLARALVEALAFSVRDIVDAMGDAADAPCAELRVDGGVSAMRLLLQLQADQLRVPVVRPRCIETTALGAAMLAGLAEGVWGGLDDVTALWEEDVRTLPALDPLSADLAHSGWLRAVDRARGWARD
jgi:glycerol kinase